MRPTWLSTTKDHTRVTPKIFRKSPSDLDAFAKLSNISEILERQFLKEERLTIVCASMRQMIITLLREVTCWLPDSDASDSSLEIAPAIEGHRSATGDLINRYKWSLWPRTSKDSKNSIHCFNLSKDQRRRSEILPCRIRRWLTRRVIIAGTDSFLSACTIENAVSVWRWCGLAWLFARVLDVFAGLYRILIRRSNSTVFVTNWSSKGEQAQFAMERPCCDDEIMGKVIGWMEIVSQLSLN